MLKKSTHDVTINYISGITLIYFLISRSLTLVGCVGIYVCVYKEDYAICVLSYMYDRVNFFPSNGAATK